ncbi:hypothetical protein G7046_g6979 [Stylonectria norvegica]|nr:hypothetical protein G7046_g6979 [Stylonectria norvegica]
MRPTQALRSHLDPVRGQYVYLRQRAVAKRRGGEKQKGIVTYGLSANRQNPFAGAGHDFVFNTFRRTKAQIFFWLTPLAAGYYLMSWASERSDYLNSKAGRAEYAEEAE